MKNKFRVALYVIVFFVTVSCNGKTVETETEQTNNNQPLNNKATEILGPIKSGLSWHSGAWAPGKDGHTIENINEYEQWLGRKLDLVTSYLNYSGNLSDLNNSGWNVSFQGPDRRLCIGVPMAGKDINITQVNNGLADDIYEKVAKLLVTNGRKNAILRIGWEADIPNNWAWHRNVDNCEEYKQAWRRIRNIFYKESKDFKFTFEGSIGSKLAGASDNEAWLRLGYPGDDVVDLIGCDTYNFYHTKVNADGTGWNTVLNPNSGLGLQDVADFARAHKKGFIVPEWGLHGVEGPGDVPQYIQYMYNFFEYNKDIMTAECYFNEPDQYIKSALWTDGEEPQNPKSAELYKKLFRKQNK